MAPNDILLDDGVLGPGSTANPDGFDNLDFDVMEIANGAKDGDFPGWRQVRRDWLSLLNQGIFRPGTAVSDSHRITVEHAGWARTFVRGVGDDPAALDVNAFNTQVKAGNMLMSAGPYIDFTARTSAGAGGLGQLVNAPAGRVKLSIRVRTPAWMPIEEVRVIGNGFVVASFDATTAPRVRPTPANFQKSGGTLRFRGVVPMTVTQDTYFIVEAGPKIPASITTLPVPPPIVDIVAPDVVPLAVTNPIFIDKDGNGSFNPPGLPVMTVRAAPTSMWARLGSLVDRLLARLGGEAVAEGAPGEMTGVTDEKKAEAAKRGEFFPIYEFSIPKEALEELERGERGAPPSTGERPAPEDGR
jgi:hypothetical protein